MKLLTWNIQAAIGTGSYRDYLLRAHRQLVHTEAKTAILKAIAQVIADYDIVGLQEVDLGGRRAGYRCQATDLAALAGFAHVEVQENRTVRGLSRHGNAILSRWPMRQVRDIKLPGRVPGRGCLIATVEAPSPVTVACLHLSLGTADQTAQLEEVARHLRPTPAWVAMGDFNCQQISAPLQAFIRDTDASVQRAPASTFPAWKPRRDYDHIIASPDHRLSHYGPLELVHSDHLPVEAELER